MKYREIIQKLQQLGCEETPRRGRGSHRKWFNPRTRSIVPVPDWGNKDLKLGTLCRIIRQLGLDWEEFKRA